MRTIVFRIIGGKGIGYGHFFRTYTLAKSLKKYYRHFRIVFIINEQLVHQFSNSEFKYFVCKSFEEDIIMLEKLKPQLLILDSYMANDNYLLSVKSITKLMIFDDNNNIYDSTIPDILLNGNIYAKNLNYIQNKDSQYLLGSSYLVMRKEYCSKTTIDFEEKDGILVTTGGTDPFKISYNLLLRLRQLPYKKRVIIGPGYEQDLINDLEKIKDEETVLIYMPKSILRYIKHSKVAITACGSTVYEVLSQKTNPVIFSMADNQDNAYKHFSKLGIFSIGKYPTIEYDVLNEKILNLMKGKYVYDSDVFSVVDGQGAIRVCEHINYFLKWNSWLTIKR